MDMFLWDSYAIGEVNDKIKYWIDLWEDFIENSDNDLYGLNMINPHLLLIDIIDETRFNRMKNPKIKEYFKIKIGLVLKNDPVIKNSFKTDFTLIIRELESNRPKYFIELCESVQKSFKNGLYFKESCEELKKILISSKWETDDDKKISLISQNLIVELILLGYSKEKIINIPKDLFDKYSTSINMDGDKDGGILTTRFPVVRTIAQNFTKENVLDKIKFNEALKKEIDALTISDRIGYLKLYCDEKENEDYIIFRIEGLKGENIDINIGNVNFYSSKKTSLKNDKKGITPIIIHVADPKSLKNEDFNINKLLYFADQVTSVNAAAKIKYRDLESARIKGIESIEKSFDILRCYLFSEIPFGIKTNDFIVVNSAGLSKGGSSSVDKSVKWYREFHSVGLEQLKNKTDFDNIAKILYSDGTEKFPMAKKLAYSLHWYRKAFETNNPEDKLLNYWIVVENLLTFDSKDENLVLEDGKKNNKFTLVEELVPPIDLMDFIIRISNDLYFYLNHLINTSQNGRQLLTLRDEDLNACQLRKNGDKTTVDLKEFINNVSRLEDLVSRKIIKDKIIYAKNFYLDRMFAKEEIIRRLEQTKLDLLIMYRYRNLIVHNAHFDNTILPYYIIKAQRFARTLLLVTLEEFIANKTSSHEEILLSKKVKIDRMIERLKNNEPVDLWNY